MELSDSDYHSENDEVCELENLKETLENHKVEWPEVVYESKCDIFNSFSSTSLCSFVLPSISESIEENEIVNESEKESVDEELRKVETMKGRVDEASKRLEIASKLLDEGQVSILGFLKMLDTTGEWFPNDSKLSFEFEEETTENETIHSIMKDYYGADWSSPYQFEFNFDT